MSKGGRVHGPSRRGELVAVADIVQPAQIAFNPDCLKVCGELQEFLGGSCLGAAAPYIVERAQKYANCQGQLQKFFGRTACGSKWG